MSFSEVAGGAVSFPSTWRSILQAKGQDSQTQTHAVTVESQSTQAATYCSSGCQASSATDDEDNYGEGKTDSGVTDEGKEMDLDAEPRLQEFLSSCTPLMLRELDRTTHSRHSFGGFEEEASAFIRNDDDEEWKQLRELSCHTGLSDDEHEQDSCTGLAWSCTGTQLAVSFGSLQECGWSSHSGRVCIWNVFGRSGQSRRESLGSPSTPSDGPDLVLRSSSGFMCVAYHPCEPALLAGGNFNGEVCVWNTALQDEPLIATSPIEDYCHREPVTSLQWIKQAGKSKGYHLASVSGDGRVLVWAVHAKSRQGSMDVPTYGYSLVLKGDSAMRGVGATSMAFAQVSNALGTMFVVGTEGGSVYRCRLHVDDNAAASTAQTLAASKRRWDSGATQLLSQVKTTERATVKRQAETYASKHGEQEVTARTVFRATVAGGTDLYRDAASFKFVAHKGSVYGCHCSPFHRNLFASCGMDGHVRIGSFLQHLPLMTLEQGVSSCYLYDVKWSPSRPTVLAAATGTGSALVFDLGGDVDAPIDLPAGGPSGNAVLALEFNKSVRGVLATGDAAGVVRVFKLGWFYSNRQKTDAAVLRSFETSSDRHTSVA